MDVIMELQQPTPDPAAEARIAWLEAEIDRLKAVQSPSSDVHLQPSDMGRWIEFQYDTTDQVFTGMVVDVDDGIVHIKAADGVPFTFIPGKPGRSWRFIDGPSVHP